MLEMTLDLMGKLTLILLTLQFLLMLIYRKITWTIGCFSNSAFDIYIAALNSIWVLATMPLAFLALFLLLRFYIKTFREINRLGMVSRSPLMNHLGETINGVSTIRTFNLQKSFINTSYKSLAVITNTNFWRESLRSWFAIRIEIITLFIFGVAAGFLVSVTLTIL